MRRSKWMVAASALVLVVAAGSAYKVSTGRPISQPILVQASAEEAAPAIALIDHFAALAEHNLDGEQQDFMVRTVAMLSQLTGPGSPSLTDQRWNISGTDLGFSFIHNGQIHMVFGDTWGRAGVEGSDWRSNTMVVVEPHSDHGYVVTDAVMDDHGDAIELLSSMKQTGIEKTVIPHAGISIDGRMYLHYLSIREWQEHDWGYQQPVPNGSGFAWSDDHGHTWTKDSSAYWTGNSAFSQAAMIDAGEYVYVFGTPAGRFGSASLMRVPRDGILTPHNYAYWTGSTWDSDPALAAEVVPAPVGELSVRWSEHHGRWLMMYLNDVTHNIVLRTTEQLEGPWDDERVIVSAAEYPTLYAPLMLPITGPDIHFTMSIFKPDYQVYIMRLTLYPGLLR